MHTLLPLVAFVTGHSRDAPGQCLCMPGWPHPYSYKIVWTKQHLGVVLYNAILILTL